MMFAKKIFQSVQKRFRSGTTLNALTGFTNVYKDISFDTLVEMFEKSCEVHSGNRAIGTKVGKEFHWLSFKDLHKMVGRTRSLLQHLGVNKGDNIAIISNNRWEWAAIAYAAYGRGAAVVPMYEAQLEQDWRYVIEDSDSKIVFCATQQIFDKITSYEKNLGKVEQIICLDCDHDKNYSFQRWLQQMENTNPPALVNVTADDVCSIVYTSGTTGKPKGVELTHGNIVANLKGGKYLAGEYAGHNTTVCILPWAHISGQTGELHAMISFGSALAIAPNRDAVLECIEIIKPTLMICVPIFFHKVHDRILNAIQQQSRFVQYLFKKSLSIARERNHKLEYGIPLSPWLRWKHTIVDLLVLKKVRQRLGGNLQRMGSGGAAISLQTLQFFEDIGIPIIEAYGMTETSPVMTCGTISWENRRLGTVGPPIPGIDVKIVEPGTSNVLPPEVEGEVACTGPIVMKGYRKNSLANDEVFFNHNGKRYIRTGDLGRFIDGKYLKITGRIKEQFKLENGKFVVPSPIEDIFSRGPMILQSYLTGNNQKFCVLLIVPNYLELKTWAEKHHPELLVWMPKNPQHFFEIGKNQEEIERLQQLFQSPSFIRKISNEIIQHSKHCKNYERPLIWMPLVTPFSQENQMLTPKMSLRRLNIAKTYESLVQDMYDGKIGNRIDFPSSSFLAE